MIALWTISILFAVLMSHPLRSGDGFRWIFFEGPAFDYYDYTGRMYYLHRAEFFTHPGYKWYYPAAGIFPLQFFYSIGRWSNTWLAGYLSYVAIAVTGAVIAALKAAKGLGTFGVSRRAALTFTLSAVLFSWPIYFSLERGNIESITWLLLAGALFAYGKERWVLAAVLLGTVAAFKFYPALCFALFLRPRRWKELGAGVLTMVAVTIAALRYILPDVLAAMRGVSSGMAQWINDYARSYGPQSATYDHSLYELVKVVTQGLKPNYATFLEHYMLVIGVIALGVFFARVIRLPRTNQVIFLITAAVYLPPASLDYTLQNLYVALGWLVLAVVAAARRGTLTRAMECSVLLFAFVLGPETFLMWHDVTAAGLLKSVLLLMLLIVTVAFPMEEIGGSRGVGPVDAAERA